MLDSNVPSFARHTANRLTRICVSDVRDSEETFFTTDNRQQPEAPRTTSLSVKSTTMAPMVCSVTAKRKKITDHSTYINIRTLYTLKSPW